MESSRQNSWKEAPGANTCPLEFFELTLTRLTANSCLRARRRVVVVPEAVGSELLRDLGSIRVHVGLALSVEEPPWHDSVENRVRYRRDRGVAGPLVVVEHLDVLEHRDVLLLHDRSQRRDGHGGQSDVGPYRVHER